MHMRFRTLLALSVPFVLCGFKPVQVDNKDVVRRSHEEVWSDGRLSVIDEIYTEDFVCHFLVGPKWQGRPDVADRVAAHRSAFPDWREDIVRLIAEGDMVVAHFVGSGTNLGEFRGNPSTGKFVKIHEIAIYRLENGLIAEQWGFPDIQGLSRQLGIEPPVTNVPE